MLQCNYTNTASLQKINYNYFLKNLMSDGHPKNHRGI